MKLLHHYFEEHADKHPDNIALICHGTILTYKDIEERSNQMAHWLREKGIREGDIIAVMLDRSVDLYVTILAIHKLGAVYLPLDVRYPQTRTEYILSNSQAKLLLTTNLFYEKSDNYSCAVIIIEDQDESVSLQPTERITQHIMPADLCYVIYTSGTTGWPKGVKIANQSICNFIEAALQVYGVTAEDRIYQGFSIAFDASLEEIWLAFASGATLVVGAYDATHASAGLEKFFKQHQITVFSTVPTMLAMIEEQLPTLRILILGGELCSQDLIQRWMRPGLRIFNTYGPTEATIVTTYTECDSGKPVTIGKPIPNCEVIILDENLEQVKNGDHGELCIGGAGLSLGYINNDELNQKKFIPHPAKNGERLYRSGDIAFYTGQGDIQFVDRVDNQIKLRGFRIELSGLESALKEYPGVRNAVVSVYQLVPGVKSLVAYLVLKDASEIDQQAIADFMHSRYPEYMVPALFEIISSLPLLPSGKIDRNNLPAPKSHLDKEKSDYIAPRSKIEKIITSVWEELFKHKPVSIRDDFFHNLGGHSLLAAKAASILRKNSYMKHVSALDIYECPTIELLAKRIIAENLDETENIINETPINGNRLSYRMRYLFCSIGQILGTYFQFALSSWQFLIIFLSITWAIETASLFSFKFFAVLMAIFLFLEPALYIIVILLKWLMLGRVKPGKYRLWGWFYFRWWLVQQLNGLLPLEDIVGLPFFNLYCRLMGSKIGKNCYINTDAIDTFDLLSIGDDSSIGDDTMIQGYVVEDGWLKIGYTKIGNRCYVGADSILGINTTLCDGARLGEHSALPAGTTIPKDQGFAGSPARPAEVIVPVADQYTTDETSKLRQLFNNAIFCLAYYMSLMSVLFIYCLSITPGIVLIDYYSFFHLNITDWLWVLPVSSFAYISILAVSAILLKRIIIGRVQPGTYKIQSLYYVRKWLAESFIDLADEAMSALYSTIYATTWYKLLGAKIGKRTELSTLSCSFPDLLTIGEECFIADGALLGASRAYRGYAQFDSVKLGKRVFIGNSALVPVSSELGDNCLIGCLSQSPNINPVPVNTSWLGSPPMLLPRREVIGSFAEKETYVPSLKSLIARGVVDFLKIIFQPIIFFLILAVQFVAIKYLLVHVSMMELIFIFPMINIAISTGVVLFIIALKWLLIGRYKVTIKPAWNPYVWLSEFITGLYDSVAVPLLLDSLLGTPFYAVFLRLFGAKIGARTYINTTFFSEFDLIEIGNDVSLNADTTIQTHLFEDRVMKMANITIEDACSIGLRSIILYDTVMEKHSSLADLSLLMKGEILPAYNKWKGIPAQQKNIKSKIAEVEETFL